MDQPTHGHYRVEKFVVDPSKVTAGSTFRMDFKSLADAFAGEPAHLVALHFVGTIALTVGVGGNGNDAYAVLMHRAMRAIRLVVAGHEHLQDIDGEDLIVDEAIRTGFFRPSQNTYAALATGATSKTFDAVLWLGNPAAPDERRHDGAVACRLFEDSARSFLEFNVASSSIGAGSDLVVSTGFTALTVYAVCVVRNDLVKHTPWRLFSQSFSDLRHELRIKGAAEYIANVNRSTNITMVDHSSTDWQSLAVGGQTLHNALTSTDYQRLADNLRACSHVGRLASSGYLASPSTSVDGWTGVPLYAPPVDARLTKRQRGTVGVSLGSMPAGYNSRIRYLCRETGEADLDHTRRVLQGVGVDPASAALEVKSANGGGQSAGAILPARVLSHSAPYEGPRRRLMKKAGA